jgi:hypothetical protein
LERFLGSVSAIHGYISGRTDTSQDNAVFISALPEPASNTGYDRKRQGSFAEMGVEITPQRLHLPGSETVIRMN